MTKAHLVVCRAVEGVVDYNDGEFAEVQTVGIDGIETDLRLATIQVHREDTNDTPEEFQRRFPVGTWVDIRTTTEITNKSVQSSAGGASRRPPRAGPSIEYDRAR